MTNFALEIFGVINSIRVNLLFQPFKKNEKMRFTKPLSCRFGAFSCTAVKRFAVLQLPYGSEPNIALS